MIRILFEMFFVNRVSFLLILLIWFNIIQSQSEDKLEIRAHKEYKELLCAHRRVTSMSKMRDNKYFISTNGQNFWLIGDSEEATDKNSRDLKTITSDWNKIDASFYYGLNVECNHEFRDKLILVNFNPKTTKNEIIVGSLTEWKWSKRDWKDFNVFVLSSKIIDWNKVIDGMAIIDESVFIFQNQIQSRIDCLFEDNKWSYKLNEVFREIPINGPIDAMYFEDKHENTFPLYVIRGDYYHICYIKETNEEFPTCEAFPVSENSMIPQPLCYVSKDPNERTINSLFVQMIILFILLIILTVFSIAFLWNLWFDSSLDISSLKDKETIDKSKIEKIDGKQRSRVSNTTERTPISTKDKTEVKQNSEIKDQKSVKP